MTMGGDFMPVEAQEGPGYPKVFGLTITPLVGALGLVAVGALLAYLLWSNLVQGTLDRNRELKTDIAAKEEQLRNQADTQKQIADAKVRLQSAKQLQGDVRTLFATEDNLNTLLLDVNERVQSVNAGVTDPAKRASLAQFDLNTEASGLVNDSSLGTEVNGKLERRVYDVQIRGTYPQTQSIIRNIERLQPLLVVTDLVADLDRETQKILLDDKGRVTPTGQPDTQILTSFKLSALLPVDPNKPVAPASP